MAYRTNPFLERMSESTTSDQDFVSLFSPKILERLSTDAFDGGLHVFRSPPGCGKTTLLRSFTPSALRAFWQVRRSAEFSESCHRLSDLGAMDAHGPQVLGVFLSCASGYADLPPGAQYGHDGLFRALLDCRIVLRTLRNLVVFSGAHSIDQLAGIAIEYDDCASDLKSIPLLSSAIEL